MTVFEALEGEGIRLGSAAAGRRYVICPRCSPHRKAAHQRLKVLGVTVEHDHAFWGCNHCGWTGAVGNSNGRTNGRAPRITYDYADEDGNLIFQKVRNHPGEEPPFWIRHLEGTSWVKGRDKAHAGTIYRLPQVRKAIEEGRAIVIVEGEKDVDRLWRLGIPATCNPDGASEPGKHPKWRQQHSEHLRGSDVILTGDNDDAGRAHMESTALSLSGVAARVRVLNPECWHVPPRLPDGKAGKDVSDWLDADRAREKQIAAVLQGAMEFVPKQKTSDNVSADHDAKDTAADDVIADLNRKYCVVNDNGSVLVFRDRYDDIMKRQIYDRMSAASFKLLHKNEVAWVKGEGGGTERRPLADLWLSHSERRTYQAVVFDPSRKAAVGILNLWRGYGFEPKAGDWSKMKAHILDNVCAGNDLYFAYLMNWMALLVQQPAEQGQVAIIMRGKRGVGKGILGHMLRRLFGQHGMYVSKSKHLVGAFNSHLRDCVLLFADEAFFAGDRAAEGTLKALITEDTLIIEPKGQNVILCRNRLHIVMASNDDWVVPAGLDERRYFILDVGEERIQDHAYFGAIVEQMDSGGCAAMLHELLRRDIKNFQVRKVPSTDALDDQKKHSLKTEEAWLQEILARGMSTNQSTGLPTNLASGWSGYQRTCFTRPIWNMLANIKNATR
jgi:hypothetical protein